MKGAHIGFSNLNLALQAENDEEPEHVVGWYKDCTVSRSKSRVGVESSSTQFYLKSSRFDIVTLWGELSNYF
jgi:hypothetical protein